MCLLHFTPAFDEDVKYIFVAQRHLKKVYADCWWLFLTVEQFTQCHRIAVFK